MRTAPRNLPDTHSSIIQAQPLPLLNSFAIQATIQPACARPAASGRSENRVTSAIDNKPMVKAVVTGDHRAEFEPRCFESGKSLRLAHSRSALALLYGRPAGPVRSLRRDCEPPQSKKEARLSMT